MHRFNRTQQDALLPHVEEGLLVLVGATTENPYFSLTGPLLSRSTLFRLEPLAADDLETLIDRALADTTRGLADEPAEIDAGARTHLASRSEGDARHVLTCLELAHALAAERAKHEGAAEIRITLQDAEAALAMRALHYGDDEHYDVTSAFIKSMRGSDPDAAVYWLARMLEAGEDPRFIARRVVIFASEDVGLADPHALQIATAAAHAVELVGLPEARINLAHAVTYNALAEKSNTAYTALGRAQQAIRERPAGAVPMHLRDASYASARNLGHGEGYRYPHDAPSGWVDQDHRPPEVAGETFYRPGAHGAERALVEQWRARRGEHREATQAGEDHDAGE